MFRGEYVSEKYKDMPAKELKAKVARMSIVGPNQYIKVCAIPCSPCTALYLLAPSLASVQSFKGGCGAQRHRVAARIGHGVSNCN